MKRMSNELIKLINTLVEQGDIFFDEDDLNEYDEIDITIIDFIGFNEDWSEEFRDDIDHDKINLMYEMLRNECIECSEDFYCYYEFKDYTICVGHTAMDI